MEEPPAKLEGGGGGEGGEAVDVVEAGVVGDAREGEAENCREVDGHCGRPEACFDEGAVEGIWRSVAVAGAWQPLNSTDTKSSCGEESSPCAGAGKAGKEA